jgi:predicted NAD/FAD-binding protein
MTELKKSRIGIVGAGPAGLSLAKLLREKGYKNITLLEATERVGGKALSVNHDGVEYNLGACYVTTGYGLVRKWLKEYDIESKRQVKPTYVGQENEKIDFIPYLMEGTNPLSALLQCIRYVALWSKFYIHTEVKREISNKYLEQLSMPAVDWFSQHRIPFIAKPCRRGYQVMGYGVLEKVPMLHVLRWVTPTLLMSGIFNLLFEVRGFETLFTKIAKDFDVRLKEPVIEVLKKNDIFEVSTSLNHYQFDTLVMACDLDSVKNGLELINSKVADVKNALDYKLWVVRLAEIQRDEGDTFYQEEVVNFPNAWEEVADGKTVGFRKSIFDATSTEEQVIKRDTYLTGQVYFDDKAFSEEHSMNMLGDELKRRGGDIKQIHGSHITRYSPTYTPESIRSDLLKTMRAMQGESKMYFTGATFSHESVKNIVNFNRYLADKIDADLSGKRKTLFSKLRNASIRLQLFNL